jgi:enediyne biosynthesis protein E4
MRSFAAICVVLFAVWLWRLPATGASPGPIVFENIIDRSGVHFVMDSGTSPRKHQIETMLSGVAIFDYNNDGLMDLYFVNGARLPDMDKSDPRYWNRLYRNNGDGTFTDVTEKAGVRGAGFGMGAAAADYDNDGWVDLYVTGVNRNQLFHNNGDGTFTDVTEKAGLAGVHPKLGKTWSISAGWFDYDNDGRLDLFVTNYVNWSLDTEPLCKTGDVVAYCSPNSYTGQPNMLFHNNGDGTFTDVSDKSGVGKHVGKGMGVVFADYDGDGFTDVFVSNDTYRNFLFHNDGNGTFREVGTVSGVAYNENGKSIAGMGADFRDVDNDGRPDIFVVGMIGDTFPLFRNRGKDFTDVTAAWGIAGATARMTAWGAGIADFDNDGWKDLFAACSSILDNSEQIDHLPSKLPNKLLRNMGGTHFVDVGDSAGASFAVPQAHRGMAYGDLNNDGRIDVVVTIKDGRPEILLNRSAEKNQWLLVKLAGTRSNRDGLGARLKATLPGGSALYNHATTSTGLGASSDPRVHFGLGAAQRVEKLEIWWPSGMRQILENVPANQILTVHEPAK